MKSANRNTRRDVVGATLLLVVLTVLCPWSGMSATQAGDLNPPPGPVAPTMKPLTDLEPRIAINATNTPGDADSLFRIAQPGSYYLTGNITGVSGKMGIEIAAGGVTIDLMGFELAGVPGSLDGIATTPAVVRSAIIHNGILRDWGGDGIQGPSQVALLSDLQLINNANHGISGGSDYVVTRCSAFGNGGDGIVVALGSVVKDCTSVINNGRGIVTQSGCVISGCTASANTGDGITTLSGSTVTACASHNNQGGSGFVAGGNCTLTGCTANANLGAGIVAGSQSTITGCTVTSNRFDGIVVGSNSRVTDNLSSSNGNGGQGAGIVTGGNSSRIEGNTVSGNDIGIILDGAVTGNIVVRNSATFNSTNYINPAIGNFIGTIITGSAAMNAASNGLVNISFSGL
jgi:parallel beta-helix repeat protein